MSITTYSELQTAIANWMGRDDLTSRIPEFITLAEAKFNRNLEVRQMEQRSTTTVDTTSTAPEFITLPSDFQSMRRICLSSVTGKPPLRYLSPTEMYDFRSLHYGDDTDQPKYFTIIGSELELLPGPDQNYTIEMVYRKKIPALDSASNTTNWLLTLAPDAYLYGALLEAAIYMEHDERIPLWVNAYSGAIDALTKLNFSAAFSAGPPAMRVVGVTP